MSPTQYHNYGLSVIPCRDDKRPLGKWADAQTAITPAPESTHHGIVCGGISGHLECIDYDKKHDQDGFYWEAYKELINNTHPDLWDQLLIESTVNDGYHIVYRCPDVVIPGATRLAASSPEHYFLETRGEGNYFVCAPSPGYQLVQRSYDNIPTITRDQRDLLISAARSLDATPPEEAPQEISERAYVSGSLGYSSLSPFDHYDQDGDILSLLQAHGWSVAFTKPNSDGTTSATYLTRPGKRYGVSATFNYNGSNRLYVFSTSTPFPANRAYKPCAVYAYLEHNQDYKQAARTLAAQGFGKRSDGTTRQRTVTTTDGGTIEGDEIPHKAIIEAVYQRQYGDGELAALIFGDTVRYDPTTQQWCIFDHHDLKPGHWGIDTTKDGDRVRLLVQQTLIQCYTNAIDYEKSHEQSNLQDFQQDNTNEQARTKTNKSRQHIDALTKRISELRMVPYSVNIVKQLRAQSLISGTEWDKNPMLLGVSNGVVDLRTGKLRAAVPQDFIRRTTPTAYDPHAVAPRFLRFIHEIHGENQADEHAPITDFMHKLIGYAITGLTTEHIYPILWGSKGRNGKDTLLDTIRAVLGNEIAKPASKDTVVSSGRRNQGAATPELYDLWGARIVWVNETEESDRLRAAQLKELSGGGTIKCRPLHGNMIEFDPTHLGLLITNHKPHAPSDDQALWERIVLVPYTQRFLSNPDPNNPNEHAVDKLLKQTLNNEAMGILAWFVQGCLRWQDEGLTIPDVLKAGTEDYRAELDSVAEWIDEKVTRGTTETMTTKDAYKSYKTYCEENGIHAYGTRRFSQDLVEKGFTKVKDSAGMRGRGFSGGSVEAPKFTQGWN